MPFHALGRPATTRAHSRGRARRDASGPRYGPPHAATRAVRGTVRHRVRQPPAPAPRERPRYGQPPEGSHRTTYLGAHVTRYAVPRAAHGARHTLRRTSGGSCRERPRYGQPPRTGLTRYGVPRAAHMPAHGSHRTTYLGAHVTRYGVPQPPDHAPRGARHTLRRTSGGPCHHVRSTAGHRPRRCDGMDRADPRGDPQQSRRLRRGDRGKPGSHCHSAPRGLGDRGGCQCCGGAYVGGGATYLSRGVEGGRTTCASRSAASSSTLAGGMG